MNQALTSKFVSVTPPAAIVNNASLTTGAIDTLGFDYCVINCYLGATDIELTALKVQESDDNGSADSYADVTGLVYGTSTDIGGSTSALPGATDDNKLFRFEIDLRGRERYLDVVATFGNGSAGGFMAIFAELYRGDSSPRTKAQRNLGNCLRI